MGLVFRVGGRYCSSSVGSEVPLPAANPQFNRHFFILQPPFYEMIKKLRHIRIVGSQPRTTSLGFRKARAVRQSPPPRQYAYYTNFCFCAISLCAIFLNNTRIEGIYHFLTGETAAVCHYEIKKLRFVTKKLQYRIEWYFLNKETIWSFYYLSKHFTNVRHVF